MTQTINDSPESTKTGAPIHIESITKQFGEFTALDGVDLNIHEGEFLTLLGASGSGKSTLLNIIAGFTKPTSGRVEVDGVDLTKVPPHRRGLGMVFQHYALFPHMSVADNVAFALKRHKFAKSEIPKRVADALEMVELGHLGKRRPSELSGGQQQRVALARSIVFRPRVLLMDEPLGALDKMLREQLQLEIRRLHKQMGITFVFVTHDQDEALTMSDRIALLRNGEIVQLGTPTELYETPNSRYSAEFVGISNIFPGAVQGDRFVDELNKCSHRLTGQQGITGSSLLIRPERLRVTANPQVPETADKLAAVVEDTIYLGSIRTVQARTDAGQLLIARTDVPREDDGIFVGARVTVQWEVGDAHVLA